MPQPEAPVREDVETREWERVSRLVHYVYDRSPYYRRRLDAAGAQPERLRSLEDFRSAVPLMRKEDVLADQEASPPYGERLCVPTERLVQVNTTGGTSGRGQEVYGLTASDVAILAETWARGVTAAGLRPGDVVGLTFTMSMAAGPLWIHEAFRRLDLSVLHLGPYDTRTKLAMMQRFGARAVVATPSYLHTLSETAADLGIDVANDLPVDVILTATESYSVGRARRLEATWGARVHEWYGSTQRALAWTCELGALVDRERKGLLHHFPELLLYETLDPETGRPVDCGEEGEVVITFLHAEGTPLLRFATGDRAPPAGRLVPVRQSARRLRGRRDRALRRHGQGAA